MYVYFIAVIEAFPPRVKIGKARDPKVRMSELQTGCPYELKLLGSIKCKSDAHAYELERMAHRSFSGYRKRGEWFHYHKNVKQAIEKLLIDNSCENPYQFKEAIQREERAKRKLKAAIEKLPVEDIHAPSIDMDREFRAIVG